MSEGGTAEESPQQQQLLLQRQKQLHQQQQPHQEPQQQQQQQQQQQPLRPNQTSIGCQTDPNLIDKLIDTHIRKQLDDIDLYQEYVRSAQCSQFWPLDKNPIRSLVPAMLKVDLPERHLKNESLMFDLVQAITNNSKLVNLLAKYIHHIVPNVIISKRIDLIPLITCTIRVCRDTNEQERLLSLLFNLIKRPNEEQRRMILSGIIVVLQVSPHQSSSLLLPNLWDHVTDKFPERRILLAESCATLAHYVRPVMRTNLILSILIQLLRDKNAAVRSAASKSFACLLTLIMDRNDEVFDACLSATEDIIQDVLQQTPVNFCEHRHELEQMRHCALETIYPLLCMWAVKLNRFKVELAEFYLAKADKCFAQLLQSSQIAATPGNTNSSSSNSPPDSRRQSQASLRRQSSLADSSSSSTISSAMSNTATSSSSSSSSGETFACQRAMGAYLKMLDYLTSFVFSDAVNGCAWLSKSSLHLTSDAASTIDLNNNYESPCATEPTTQSDRCEQLHHQQPCKLRTADHLFDRPLKFVNKLLEPTLIIDESAIVAFHDQLEQDHHIESVEWILGRYLPRLLDIVAHFANKKFPAATGGAPEIIQEFLQTIIASVRQLCLLFGKHLTRTKIRPLIKKHLLERDCRALFFVYIASLTSFEPIEQTEYDEIVVSVRTNLTANELSRDQVEMFALAIKVMATNSEQIHSPSTRHKFLTYILDALVNYSNQIIRSAPSSLTAQQSLLYQKSQQLEHDFKLSHTAQQQQLLPQKSSQEQQSKLAAAVRLASGAKGTTRRNSLQVQHHQTQTKEFMLIIFRHILTCLIDHTVRPPNWAHILVTKFLPLIILLANDSADVYVCTYARLMCAQLVETFDTYLNCPTLTRQTADSIVPALHSLKSLTDQIKASNLRRQIEFLMHQLNEKFYNEQNQQQQQQQPTATTGGRQSQTPPPQMLLKSACTSSPLCRAKL